MSAETEVKTKTATKEKAPKAGDLDAKIISKHMFMSMGVGAVPIPFLDMVGITAIQLHMIKKISKNHGDLFNKQIVVNVVSSLVGAVGAQSAATGTLGSLVKTIPVIGSVAGAVTYPAIAGATTFALGQVFVRHYESGGTLLTLKTSNVKDVFKEQYEKGKERVKSVKDAAIGKTN
jgi:uncharacterized protein (DUF697 family)